MRIQDEARQRSRLLSLLKEIRQKSGVRQVDLAEHLGVPQSFVSKYEVGDRQLDVLELRQICQTLGISLKEFVQLLEEKLDETQQ